MKQAILTLSYIIIFGIATSQNRNDTIINIGEVKITEPRLLKNKGFNINEIDSAVLAENIMSSLSELLSSETTVFVKSYGQGSLATVSFRGTGASHTQILWNDISLNNPMLGQADISLIPVFFIDKAELDKGGSSLKSVSGALGGSIVLISEPDFDKDFSFSIMQTAGSNDTYQTFSDIKTGNDFFRSEWKFFHEQSDNDFTFLNTADGTNSYTKQKNADYHKNAVLNETSFIFSKNGQLNISAWWQYIDRNIPPIMSFDGNERTENQKDEDIRISANCKISGKKSQIEINAGFTSENIKYILADKTETSLFFHTNSESKTKQFFAKYKINRTISSKLVLQGKLLLKYDTAHYFDRTVQTGYGSNRKTAEILMSAHYQFNKTAAGYILTGINRTDKDFLPLISSAGLEFDLSGHIPLIIKTNISRNVRNPSLNDLYWIPGGNPDLKTEKSISGDTDFNFYTSGNKIFKTEINISLFASYINDWIIWTPGEYGYWTAENIRKVFSRGAEIYMSEKYKTNNFTAQIRANYSYTKTTDESEKTTYDLSAGKQLTYIPLHKANITADCEFKGYYLRWSHIYTGKRYTDSSNEEYRHTLPAYYLENLSAGKKIKKEKITTDIEFKIENLLNENYQEILWRAMPGRQYFLSVKFTI
ncbi:MAG: TonB-dependent receptor plug domain-containing protein [Chlorobi bacterium]|nr:TonB-dependent receptor plug domain-containing protein [Chlorobiota bacterium]